MLGDSLKIMVASTVYGFSDQIGRTLLASI